MLFDARWNILAQSIFARGGWHACYLQNRLPNKTIGLNTTHSMWFSHKPHLGHLHVFGSTAYSHILEVKKGKVEPHDRTWIFMSYGESWGVRAHKLFHPKVQKILFNISDKKRQKLNAIYGLEIFTLNAVHCLDLEH